MNLLLDTHVALWALGEPERLGPTMRAAIEDPRNAISVSAASVWEVEIKRALGQLSVPDGFGRACVERDFAPLDITFEHALRAGRLERHHDDPFDRMLIGQAFTEDCRIATVDPAFEAYGVSLFDART